jgi:hypothetical protein
MSERIEAIAAQCRAENWERADLDYVQFAKMIIADAIQVMVANDYHGEWLGEKLKEHFGVEL